MYAHRGQSVPDVEMLKDNPFYLVLHNPPAPLFPQPWLLASGRAGSSVVFHKDKLLESFCFSIASLNSCNLLEMNTPSRGSRRVNGVRSGELSTFYSGVLFVVLEE